MGCRITGRLVSPTGAPAAGTLRLTPAPAVAALPAGGAVMVGAVTATTDDDGALDVAVTAPEGVSWTVQLTVPGTVHVARPGVVLPADGDVALAWLLGLAPGPDPEPEPGPGAGAGVVVADDGATFTAPAVAVVGGTFTIEGVVSDDGATYTIKTGGADG